MDRRRPRTLVPRRDGAAAGLPRNIDCQVALSPSPQEIQATEDQEP